MGRDFSPGRGKEVLEIELGCTEEWGRQARGQLASFTTKNRKIPTRLWLPKVRPWSEAVARMLFLIKICDKIYPLILWLGTFSSSSI